MDGATLRERKKHATREALVAAGLELFARDGYAATSVDAIAAAAGVARRTFFRYFAGKEELVFADDDEHLAVVLAAVDATPLDAPLLDAVAAAGHALAARLAERRAELPAWEALLAAEPTLQARSLAKHHRWEQAIAARLVERRGVAPDEARTVAKLGVACFQAAYEGWRADPAVPLTDRIDGAFAVLAGLGAPAGAGAVSDR